MTSTLRNLAAVLALSIALPACDGATSGDVQDVTETSARFETFKGGDGKYYFQLIAKNGERVLESQAYTSLTSAKKGITSVKSNGAASAAYSLLQAESGEWYFDLVAANGEVIGASETYSSKSAAQKGVTATIAAVNGATTAAAKSGDEGFETFKGTDGKTYFHLRAKNGEIVLASQGYSSKSAALSGIDSVKANGISAASFDVLEGASGQFTFRLLAANHKVIGHGEMYASKDGALHGADGVRDLLRDIADVGSPTDAQVQADIEAATGTGLLYESESDYPFHYVSAPLSSPSAPIDEATVRAAFGSLVDADPDADKPMASLYGMKQTWDDWKSEAHNCADPNDPGSVEPCHQMRNLEQVLGADLTDIQVYYFGKKGSAGHVDGIGVTVLIVGRTAKGTLAGVRTLAIWT